MKWHDIIGSIVYPVYYNVGKYLHDCLFPGRPETPGRVPQLSAYGKVLPIVFGQTRGQGSLLYASGVYARDFRGTPNSRVYYPHTTLSVIDTISAIGEGQITGIGRVWLGKGLLTPVMLSDIDLAALAVATGSTSQTAWARSAGNLAYPSVAYVYAYRPIDYDGTISDMNFEIKGLRYATGDATQGDADPALIVTDLLTDQHFGARAWFPIEVTLGADGTAASGMARYVLAEGFWLSPLFADQRPASEHLQDVLDACNCTALWSEGKLKFLPLGDTSVTGNGATFIPLTSPVYDLDRSDFLEPLEVQVPSTAEVFNIQPVSFLDRRWNVAGADGVVDPSYAYNQNTVEVGDPTDIALRGEKRATAVDMHAICKIDVAQKISRIRSQQMVYPRATFVMKLPWYYADLECFDLVTVSDELLGLDHVAARITQIEEDEAGTISITALEWPAGTNHAALRTTASSLAPTGNDLLSDQTMASVVESMVSNWTGVTLPAGVYLAVCYAPELRRFCAVGLNVCATSDDGGITWTARTIQAGTHQAVCWNGSKFLTAGQAGVSSSSADGITWAAQALPSLPTGYYGIAWNGFVFCAAGNLGSGSRAVYTSATGLSGSWTNISGIGGDTIKGVVAVGARLITFGDLLRTSDDDGASWTTRATFSTVAVSEVRGQVLVASGSSASKTSRDGGDTWIDPVAVSEYGVASTALALRGVVVTMGVGAGALYVVTSRDGGQTWTRRYPNVAVASGLLAAATNGRRVVCVGSASSFGAYSLEA